MAKSTGPLFSLSAHGSIKKRLTYSDRKNGQKVRNYSKPTRTPSPKQRARRRLMEFLVAHWKALDENTKDSWRNLAKENNPGITGYQYFLKECQRDLLTNHGLLAYYSMNWIQNNDIINLSNTGINASLLPSPPTNAPQLVGSFSKKFNNGLEFTDTAHRATSDLTMLLEEGTAELWFYLNELNLDKTLLFTGNGWYTGFKMLLLRVYNTNRIHFLTRLTGGLIADIEGDYDLKNDTWYCVAATWKINEVKLFINNEQQGVTVTVANMPAIWGKPVEIGNNSYSPDTANHKIDEVVLYNRVLSETELTRRYKYANKNLKG